MIVFVEQITERLIYSFDFIFGIRSITYQFTTNVDTFSNSTDFKFNYSKRALDSTAQIVPSSLLFETGIFQFAPNRDLFFNEECLVFDEVVDPIASIFYLLSRMEEYHAADLDKHDRFKAKNSVLSKYNWFEKAMCDRWAEDILKLLSSKGFPYDKPTQYPVKINPTFDIDNVFAYQQKTGTRRLLAIAKDMLKGSKERLAERKLVQAGKINDPYNTFSSIAEIAKRGFEVNVFWLLGDFAKFDRNVAHTNKVQQNLIQLLSKDAEVGIHPSYKSSNNSAIVGMEVGRLKAILGNEVKNSRQHYLRLRFPQTYQSLIANKIHHDYTMGYAENVGFRAGTARPFLWFDLSQEKITTLAIHPFAYMDGTLLEYCVLSIEEAKNKITHLYNEVKQYGGDFSFIWHNETIGDYGTWIGWSAVLEHSLNLNYEEK